MTLTLHTCPENRHASHHKKRVKIKYVSSPLSVIFVRFQREFTKGVAPDWIITRIEHSRLLD